MGRSPGQNLYRYAAAGMEFAILFGMWVAAGWWMDRWLGTVPVFTLSGSLIGFAAALYRLVRQVRQLPGESDERDKPPGSD